MLHHPQPAFHKASKVRTSFLRISVHLPLRPDPHFHGRPFSPSWREAACRRGQYKWRCQSSHPFILFGYLASLAWCGPHHHGPHGSSWSWYIRSPLVLGLFHIKTASDAYQPFCVAPAPSRSFPVYNLDGGVAYPQFAYPLRKEIVPIWLAAFIAFMAPFVFFVIFQIRRRSIEDLLTTTMGLLKSLITAAVFQVCLAR